VRAAGAAFARGAWLAVAREHHRDARARHTADDWRAALRLYDTVLLRWPDDRDAPRLQLGAGEAAEGLGERAEALRRYRAAADAGDDSVRAVALGQRVAVADAWYAASRPAGARADARGPDSLARLVLDTADELLERAPRHARAADAAWRQGQLAFAHGWYPRAARALGRMAERHPADPRVPRAVMLRAEALFRVAEHAGAAAAFERARDLASRAGDDSLTRRAARAVPVCHMARAEAAVAADSGAHARHAELFEAVARGWPAYEHAHAAQYRAGVAWLRAGRTREGVRALETLLAGWPTSAHARDALVRLAPAHAALGDSLRAAETWARFAARFPADDGAGPALLAAADLFEGAGAVARADAVREEYLRRHPGDLEGALMILEGFATRELDALPAGRGISGLLAARPAKGTPASRVAQYLARVRARPALASRDLVGRVRFLQGEEAFAAMRSVRLTAPLARSLPARQRHLDSTLVRYRRAVDAGAPRWAHAATFRIGEALADFAAALDDSERPADLSGADLRGYEEVLAGRAAQFRERGEGVWGELVRTTRDAAADPWLAEARRALWGRLAERFLFLPEAEFPLVEAEAPRRRDRADARGTAEARRAVARGTEEAR
jgi:TolA-binding protein